MCSGIKQTTCTEVCIKQTLYSNLFTEIIIVEGDCTKPAINMTRVKGKMLSWNTSETYNPVTVYWRLSIKITGCTSILFVLNRVSILILSMVNLLTGVCVVRCTCRRVLMEVLWVKCIVLPCLTGLQNSLTKISLAVNLYSNDSVQCGQLLINWL